MINNKNGNNVKWWLMNDEFKYKINKLKWLN